MNQAAKIVSAAIIGADFITVLVNDKPYTVYPPTINKLSGAGFYLNGMGDEQTVRDIINSINNSEKLCHAFSWLVKGDDSLFEELSQGTFDELVDAVSAAYSLVSVENFTKLSVLAKNVAKLVANQR